MSVAPTTEELVRQAKRITVKIGSSLLVEREGLRRDWLAGLVEDLAAIRSGGAQLVIVSSGAVALGRKRLGLSRSARLDVKQAAAAAGQPLLMESWAAAFARHDVPVAQLLLTFGDTESRRRWLNARATIETLIAKGAVPIVNENDSVATEELRFGDNDRLSARVAQMVRSDLLVLLSDVDGLYSANPRARAEAQHIPFAEKVTAELMDLAGPAHGESVGSGGMRTKLDAARIAASFGCATLIANGTGEHPVRALLDGSARATLIAGQGSPASAYKQWIAAALAPTGKLAVDGGAAEALGNGRSLLAAGIRGINGEFGRGECVSVVNAEGREIARGLISYSADETRAIAGLRARDIEQRLGYNRGDAVIHRNDLVLL
ncbi:MAG: glutamate 5-kinase [Sphingomonadales bacterium]|nr:glutamate 5-kinase [Sphingomonadales bacterium]